MSVENVPMHLIDDEICRNIIKGETGKLSDGMDSPLAVLCRMQPTRGDRARSDELQNDKKGLWDGGGLKKKKVKEGVKEG